MELSCRYHPNREAVAVCRICQQGACTECAEERRVVLNPWKRWFTLRGFERSGTLVTTCGRMCGDHEVLTRFGGRARTYTILLLIFAGVTVAALGSAAVLVAIMQ